MKIDKSMTLGRKTLPKFYSSRQENGANTIPDIRTTHSENSTVNVRGKMTQLEREILEVSQVLNYHK